jgi:hypothetical protein
MLLLLYRSSSEAADIGNEVFSSGGPAAEYLHPVIESIPPQYQSGMVSRAMTVHRSPLCQESWGDCRVYGGEHRSGAGQTGAHVGVFALEAIPAGNFVMEIVGENTPFGSDGGSQAKQSDDQH